VVCGKHKARNAPVEMAAKTRRRDGNLARLISLSGRTHDMAWFSRDNVYVRIAAGKCAVGEGKS
jgi:hypothetical protein